MVAHISNPSIQKVKAGGSRVQNRSGLYDSVAEKEISQKIHLQMPCPQDGGVDGNESHT